MNDYKKRKYLSSIESAKYLGITVKTLHSLVKVKKIKCVISASSQKRFNLRDLKNYEKTLPKTKKQKKKEILKENVLDINNTTQKIYVKNAMSMNELESNSIHLMVTSPPYFDAKMYTRKPIKGDLGIFIILISGLKRLKLYGKRFLGFYNREGRFL